MTKKKPPQEAKLISEDQHFAKVLEHATVVYDEILTEVGETNDELEEAIVQLPAIFICDVIDLLLDYATRYEDFDTDEIAGMLELQRDHQVRFGNRTVH